MPIGGKVAEISTRSINEKKTSADQDDASHDLTEHNGHEVEDQFWPLTAGNPVST